MTNKTDPKMLHKLGVDMNRNTVWKELGEEEEAEMDRVADELLKKQEESKFINVLKSKRAWIYSTLITATVTAVVARITGII